LAADQGYANAQYNLGVMYVIGEGVPLDNQLGYLWVNIAGENGYDVDEAREIITSRMSQADIAKAQQKTSQYIKDNPGVY
jgi:TPR repeat protein